MIHSALLAVVVFSLCGAFATQAFAQTENKRLSEFLDKQGFPKATLEPKEYSELGLQDSSSGGRDGRYFNSPGFTFTVAFPYCKQSSLAGKFVHGHYSDQPIRFPSGDRIVRTISKLLTPSSAEQVDTEKEIDKIADRFTRTGMGVPRFEPGTGYVGYVIKHHGYPLGVFFRVEWNGCMILSTSYNRYQKEFADASSATKEKAGGRISDALK